MRVASGAYDTLAVCMLCVPVLVLVGGWCGVWVWVWAWVWVTHFIDTTLTASISIESLAMVPFLDIFCNIDKINSITAPVMIVHGTQDVVVPYAHGEVC